MAIEVILFLFIYFLFVSELFIIIIIIIICCCLFSLCGSFVILFLIYLPCFFVDLGGIELALSFALLFIVCFCSCLFFVVVCLCSFFFFFFLLHRFSVLFYIHRFSVFVSSIALGTSSLRLVMSPWRLVAQRLPFRGRVLSYTIDDLGKREVRLTRFNGHGSLKRTVDYGVGRTMPGRGAVSGCSPPLVMAG